MNHRFGNADSRPSADIRSREYVTGWQHGPEVGTEWLRWRLRLGRALRRTRPPCPPFNPPRVSTAPCPVCFKQTEVAHCVAGEARQARQAEASNVRVQDPCWPEAAQLPAVSACFLTSGRGSPGRLSRERSSPVQAPKRQHALWLPYDPVDHDRGDVEVSQFLDDRRFLVSVLHDLADTRAHFRD